MLLLEDVGFVLLETAASVVEMSGLMFVLDCFRLIVVVIVVDFEFVFVAALVVAAVVVVVVVDVIEFIRTNFTTLYGYYLIIIFRRVYSEVTPRNAVLILQ